MKRMPWYKWIPRVLAVTNRLVLSLVSISSVVPVTLAKKGTLFGEDHFWWAVTKTKGNRIGATEELSLQPRLDLVALGIGAVACGAAAHRAGGGANLKPGSCPKAHAGGRESVMKIMS